MTMPKRKRRHTRKWAYIIHQPRLTRKPPEAPADTILPYDEKGSF